MSDVMLPCGHADGFAYMQYGGPDVPSWALYDGVSEIICQSCGARFGRWTNERLADGAYEPRYGGGKVAWHP